MPIRNDIMKVMVIGSGPIIIGQAAEFDYAGTQACRALKEEGLEVVLINSNPATIMTDSSIADRIYIEPLTITSILKVIKKERPDSLLPTLGGQTGLNLSMELAESGILEEYGITLLGTSAKAIRMAEDRLEFKKTMESIGEPCILSCVVESAQAAAAFAEEVGYPVIIRPAYTLGGSGGGIAANINELREIVANGLRLSRVHQVLIEKSVAGWKEIEYEVIRDSAGNVITICNMENIDPVGIHTGDSIVVAPSQTLSDSEYQMLRSASLNIISELKIEGGCNVQFALHPDNSDYAVIEVNPRVSRSSALASKATGYPIARVVSKIAVGYTLDEIKNAVTEKTFACFEPALDYVVVKMPRLPFDKFVNARKSLGTQMKATGEVMAISNSFESAFLKALRSLELDLFSLSIGSYNAMTESELMTELNRVDDRRILAIGECLRRGISIDGIFETTKIDRFFLNKFKNIVEVEEKLKKITLADIDFKLMLKIKKMGLPDIAIANLAGCETKEIRNLRRQHGIEAAFKMVDTCAGEFNAITPYYYSTYDKINEALPADKKKVLVIGSGPIRIGQGIEFDYCTVHSIWALKNEGYEAIIVNNNPETVSTDFDTSDRLYFEPLTEEDVENIVNNEKPDGAIVQFGGQTAIKLTKALNNMGVKIYGTDAENVDKAEDREKFDKILESVGIPRPEGTTVFTLEEALKAAERLEYPVLVRPSYVLGGQGMEIAYNEDDMKEFMSVVNRIKQEHPILIDKYMMGKELEVDAICDGENILIPGIMEHIERAGVHSGDSISVYPPQTIDKSVADRIVECTELLAKALNIVGLINIQYILYNNVINVIEVNPRSSRTVPFISKVTGLPMVDIATSIMVTGKKLTDFPYGTGLLEHSGYIAVKVPVFSFEKLHDVDTGLGPEMKSTGEVMGIGSNFTEALYKGLTASNLNLDKHTGGVLFTVRNSDKPDIMPIAEDLASIGFELYGTGGTALYLNQHGIATNSTRKIGEDSPNILDLIESGNIQYVINTPTRGRLKSRDGFRIRRTSVEHSVPCMTSLDTAKAVTMCLKTNMHEEDIPVVDISCIKLRIKEMKDEKREIRNGK